MRFRKIEITKPNPWQYPSRYPYFLLEGHPKPLSENEKRLIKEKREAWSPSKKAIDLHKLLNSWKGRNVLLQLENPENYYDSPEDHPVPFIAQIKEVIVESVLDSDIAFDQLFIFLSNLRHLNGESIFKEINYDYLTLLEV